MNRLSNLHVPANRAILIAAAIGLFASMLLPWYIQDESVLSSMWLVFSEERAASAFVHAMQFSRLWLIVGIAASVTVLFAGAMSPGRSQGRVLVAAAASGLLTLTLSGFLIGSNGWPNLGLAGQSGLGLGGALTFIALLMSLGFGLARLGRFTGDLFVGAAVVVCGALLLIFILYPVGQILSAAFLDGGKFSLGIAVSRITSERVFGFGCVYGGQTCGVAWNTVFLGILTATSTTLLGTFLALLSERGSRRMAGPMKVLSLLPIITPPFVVGLGLILLFGRAGVVNQALAALFGVEPSRWFYGWFGIWIAQTFAFTPIAFMIMRSIVQAVAPSLEEAAQTLRASEHRTFTSVTLPLLKPGLANAFLVGFIESMADFGNPIVVGGQFSVLSTEIFFAIVGAQYDQARAASLALVLTVFALAVFVFQRYVLRGQAFTTVTGKGDSGLPMPLPRGIGLVIKAISLPWLAFTLVVYAFAFAGGFVKTWGHEWTLTFEHFLTAFSVSWTRGPELVGSAWTSFFTTLKLAAISAPLTAVLGLGLAWLLARTKFKGQGIFEFSALIAFAIPGTVLGVSYVLAFNVPPIELTGTGIVIVICLTFRNLPVGVRAGSAAFEQLDKSLDEASTMLRASSVNTLRYVVLPLLKPALIAALVYSFVRAVTTVSAVIFLVTAEYELATTYIIGRVSNGDYGVALAYCTVLIVVMSLVTLLIQLTVGERKLGRRGRQVPAPKIRELQGVS